MRKWLLRIPLFLIGGIVVVFLLLAVFHHIKVYLVDTVYQDTELDAVETVEIDDLMMAYRTYGDSDNPTIIAVHGFMGSSYDYHALALELEEDYYIIAVDLIGFGKSDKPSDYDYSKTHQAAMLNQLITTLEVDSYTLMGHSMGGEIVLRYADAYPENIDKLILFAPAGLQAGSSPQYPLLFTSIIVKNYFIQRLVFRSVHYQDDYKNVETFDAMFYFNKSIPARTFQAFGQTPDDAQLTTLLEAIPFETLIVFGTEDTWVRPKNGTTLNDALPNSTLVLIEDTGHMPFIERLDAVHAQVENFLNP